MGLFDKFRDGMNEARKAKAQAQRAQQVAQKAQNAAGKVQQVAGKAQAAVGAGQGAPPAAPAAGGAAAPAQASAQESAPMSNPGETKLCPNGHVMDASWDRCPYCPDPSKMGRAPIPPTQVHQPAVAAVAPPPPPMPMPMPMPMPTPTPVPKAAADFKKTRVITEDKKVPVVGWLVALNGKHKGEDFRVREGRNEIGKESKSDIVLTDDYISSKHAVIMYLQKDGERIFILQDLASTNGTFLNDSEEPIAKEELVDNDTIRFGETKMKFKCL